MEIRRDRGSRCRAVEIEPAAVPRVRDRSRERRQGGLSASIAGFEVHGQRSFWGLPDQRAIVSRKRPGSIRLHAASGEGIAQPEPPSGLVRCGFCDLESRLEPQFLGRDELEVLRNRGVSRVVIVGSRRDHVENATGRILKCRSAGATIIDGGPRLNIGHRRRRRIHEVIEDLEEQCRVILVRSRSVLPQCRGCGIRNPSIVQDQRTVCGKTKGPSMQGRQNLWRGHDESSGTGTACAVARCLCWSISCCALSVSADY